MNMSQTALAAVTILATTVCFVVFGTYSVKSFVWKKTGKEATFFGSGMFYSSPAQTTEKYLLSIYPAPWAISIIWPAVLAMSLAGQSYLLHKSLSKSTDFHLPQKVFYLWSGAWILTTIWTFLFDAESHIGTLITVFFVTIFSIEALGIACKCFHLFKPRLTDESRTKNALNHPFCYLVVESLAILSMWSIVALGISIGYALAYKNSLHKTEAILTGLVTPEDSATTGGIFVLVSYTIWWTLDVAFWRKETNCIRSIYPVFALVMLSLGISNYDSSKGMTLNNLLCFGTSVLSFTSMLSRYRMKEFFAELQQKNVENRHKD